MIQKFGTFLKFYFYNFRFVISEKFAILALLSLSSVQVSVKEYKMSITQENDALLLSPHYSPVFLLKLNIRVSWSLKCTDDDDSFLRCCSLQRCRTLTWRQASTTVRLSQAIFP